MKRKSSIGCVLIMGLLLCACTDSNMESKVIVEPTMEVEELEVDYISVERFMEIYDMTKEELGDFNLQAMIIEYDITEEKTKTLNYKEHVEQCMEIGENFGYDVSRLIYGKGRSATSDDDLTGMKWMIMDNSNGMESENYIWDITNKKSYFAEGYIIYDYMDAEVINDLTSVQINQMISGLEAMDMSNWRFEPIYGANNEYEYKWVLFLVLANDEVIYYEGWCPELGNPEGFYEWLQEVIQISKETGIE